jgi:hypothetical protein
MTSYENKYIKYKLKYLILKKQYLSLNKRKLSTINENKILLKGGDNNLKKDNIQESEEGEYIEDPYVNSDVDFEYKNGNEGGDDGGDDGEAEYIEDPYPNSDVDFEHENENEGEQ